MKGNVFWWHLKRTIFGIVLIGEGRSLHKVSYKLAWWQHYFLLIPSLLLLNGSFRTTSDYFSWQQTRSFPYNWTLFKGMLHSTGFHSNISQWNLSLCNFFRNNSHSSLLHTVVECLWALENHWIQLVNTELIKSCSLSGSSPGSYVKHVFWWRVVRTCVRRRGNDIPSFSKRS